jgi:hypothetical protein
MTDTSTNIAERSSPASGSLDDIAASILVPVPELAKDLAKRKRKAKPAAPSSEIAPANSDDAVAAEDAAGGPPVSPAASSDDDAALQSAAPAEEQPSDDGEADADLQDEEGEETLFDEWADFDDPAQQSTNEGPDEEGDGDEEAQTLEITDDMTLSVKVDGEAQDVTIADLKKRYAGEGAIEKRLQEATEAKKTVVQQIEHNRTQFAQVLNAVGGMLFTPKTQAPDQGLAQTDPARFLRMQQAHHSEIAELTVRKQQLNKVMTDADAVVQQGVAAERADEATKLRQALPVLNDPVRGPKVQKAILDAAKEYYKFSDGDIAAAADHRIFVMAADAMRYRKLMSKTKAVPTPSKSRTIKPRGGANKPRVASAAKQDEKRLAQARKTGSTDDIAASMIVTKPSSRRKGRVR